MFGQDRQIRQIDPSAGGQVRVGVPVGLSALTLPGGAEYGKIQQIHPAVARIGGQIADQMGRYSLKLQRWILAKERAAPAESGVLGKQIHADDSVSFPPSGEEISSQTTGTLVYSSHWPIPGIWIGRCNIPERRWFLRSLRDRYLKLPLIRISRSRAAIRSPTTVIWAPVSSMKRLLSRAVWRLPQIYAMHEEQGLRSAPIITDGLDGENQCSDIIDAVRDVLDRRGPQRPQFERDSAAVMRRRFIFRFI